MKKPLMNESSPFDNHFSNYSYLSFAMERSRFSDEKSMENTVDQPFLNGKTLMIFFRMDEISKGNEMLLKNIQDIKIRSNIQLIIEVISTGRLKEQILRNADVVCFSLDFKVNAKFKEFLVKTRKKVIIKGNPMYKTSKWFLMVKELMQCGIKDIGVLIMGKCADNAVPNQHYPGWEIIPALKSYFSGLHVFGDYRGFKGSAKKIMDQYSMMQMSGVDSILFEFPEEPKRGSEENLLTDRLSIKHFEEMERLFQKKPDAIEEQGDMKHIKEIEAMRKKIDHFDEELLRLISNRFSLVQKVGVLKNDGNMCIFQNRRWSEVFCNMMKKGKALGIDECFLIDLYHHVHKESVDIQMKNLKKTNNE